MGTYQDGKIFSGLSLTGETISDTEFVDCEFQRCSFAECTVRRCRFTDCVFSDCQISKLTAKDSELLDGEFFGCDLTGINWSELAGDFVPPVRLLQDCRMRYQNFAEMNFSRFDFSGSLIAESMFADCNLSDSSFQGCQLRGTEFFRCNLCGADFRRAEGYQIDLMTNQVKGAKFSLPEAVSLLNGMGMKIE